MTATTHAAGELGELARDLRSSAHGLEGFATTLHHRVTAMAWKGGAAHQFREDAARYEQLTARATEVMTRLAARMTSLEETAHDLVNNRLDPAQAWLTKQINTEVQRLETYETSHPGAPLPTNAVSWLEGAVRADGTIRSDIHALEAL